MSKQVFSATRAIQLNNMNRRKMCCHIGNTMRYKNVKTGVYYCNPHHFTQRSEDLAYIVPVKGSIQRYA